MAFRKNKPSINPFSLSMAPLNFSKKALEGNHCANLEIATKPADEDVDIDMREIYFLIMHFLSNGPCKRTFGQMWNELLEHDLLPRRYHAWYSRSGAHSRNEDDNGCSLPLSYANLVSRYPHIETNHLVKLLKQLILSCSPPPHGLTGGCPISAVEVSSLLGSGAFSLLSSDGDRQLKKASCFLRYLRWPHMQANQIQGLSLREIGGGFTKHRRATSVRAACYAIAKPAALVEKMQSVRKLRGHQNAVYCAIFDRSGRYVITGSDDRLVKIWSMETAFCLSSCRGHEGDITDLAVSSNNALVASASNDFIIRIWRLPDGLPISVLKGHTGAVTAIAFSPRPSSTFHLLSSSDDGTCRIWDARHSNPSLRVYVSKPPDGLLGTGGNPTSAQQVHQILCCTYNANGTVFVTGSSDTYARVWNACRVSSDDSEQPNHEMDLLSGHENDVNYVQFSGCSVTSKFSATDTTKEDNIPKFKNSWFTHDNIVTCSRDGSAIIWIPRSRRSHGNVGRWTRAYHLKVPPPPMPPHPPRGGPRQRSQPTPRGVNMIVWSLDNRFVLAAIMDCRICVWNASDGSLVHSLIGHSESTFVLDVHPFNPRIAMSAGYDGKTIIWDIWEGIPVRIYETGRFKLVDGKFSPDGTSIVLSDEVGQIFVIATGQGESQKDAKYDQFFLGDYRPLIHDVNGNTLDQETQLPPYRRNLQDLLCDSSMIPYPEPYQNMYQRCRLGALGFEWRPSSLKFAVGPSNNINAGDYIMPVVDLERWVESLEAMPEFLDWEQENEVQSDETDSEYNVTEELSSGREHASFSISFSDNDESSAEDNEGSHSGREGLRRSKRKQSKPEVEITTSSGRRVKRRNLDEHDKTIDNGRRKKKIRNGKLVTKKKSSKSKVHRPRRRAAQNARNFLSQMGVISSDEEDDFDSDTYSSEDDSPILDTSDHSNDSDRSFSSLHEEFIHGIKIKNDWNDSVSRSSHVNEVQSSAAPKRRLVLRLPVRDSKKIFSESTVSRGYDQNSPSSGKIVSTFDNMDKVCSSLWGSGQSSSGQLNGNLSQNVIAPRIKEEDHTGKHDVHPGISAAYKVSKVNWGEVKTRSAKRSRTSDTLLREICSMGSEYLHVGTSNSNGHLIDGNDCQTRTSYSRNHVNHDDPSRRAFQNVEWSTVITSEPVDGSGNPECAIDKSIAHNQVTLDANAPDMGQVGVSCNGTETDHLVAQNFDELSGTKDFHDTCEINRTDVGKTSHSSGHSKDAENNVQPTYRKLRVASKRSIYQPIDSSSMSPDKIECLRNPDSALVSNSTMQAVGEMIPPVHEEDACSSGSSEHGDQCNGLRMFNCQKNCKIYSRSKSSKHRSSRGDTLSMKETNSNSENGNRDPNLNLVDGLMGKYHYTRSSNAKIVTDKPSSSKLRGHHSSAEGSSTRLRFSFNGIDSLQHDNTRPTKITVGLRSARNRRGNYNSCELSSIGKRNAQHQVRKASWLMLSEHEEAYRYIPQLGDEVAYIRQGHAEYLEATCSNESRPWIPTNPELRAVEFCKVVSLKYSTLPGSGESCCKLILKFIDPSSRAFGNSFKLTLPELTEIPDFLVERTRYDASIERNWTKRDKCHVWWREADGSGGWWEGRIMFVEAKSSKFPDSPWERYAIHYKGDSSSTECHRHSPWELHEAPVQWEHPCIDEMRRRSLLTSFHQIATSSGVLQRLNQASQKSDFLNRFPVPLSFEVIKRRLEANYYRTLEAVEHDSEVILSNSESYFASSTEFAAKLRMLADSITCALQL